MERVGRRVAGTPHSQPQGMKRRKREHAGRTDGRTDGRAARNEERGKRSVAVRRRGRETIAKKEQEVEENETTR